MGDFAKVGECLYRYNPTGMYYARFEVGEREVRKSLKTADRALAKRRLADLQVKTKQVDQKAGKVSLAGACDRYLATCKKDKPKTLRRKTDIAARLKRDFPGGADVAIFQAVSTRIGAWLASYSFGPPSYNLYLEFIRAVFEWAVRDKLLFDSPVESLEGMKLEKPIRKTPTVEGFQAIVAEIRAMPHNASAKESGDLVEFLGLAGLGGSEADSLVWQDIDWQAGRITTFRHKTGKEFMIPIYPQLKTFIERLLEQWREEHGGSLPALKRCSASRTRRKAWRRSASGWDCRITPRAPCAGCSSPKRSRKEST